MEKMYLGDGVYAHIDDIGQVVLTTENGVSITNTIVLENEVISCFLIYLKHVKKIVNE